MCGGRVVPPASRPSSPCPALLRLQAETDTPTFTTQTYAIVQNGEVVGMVHHVHAEAVFGRRGGPGDDRPPSPLALRLADLWSSQADALASLRDRLLATRCPLARQMALARLQLAAAAADAGTGEPTDSAELLRRWQRSEFEPGFAGMAEPAVLDWGVAEEELDVQQVAEQHVARELHHPMLGGHGAGHGMATRRPGRDGMLLPRLERDHRHGNLFGLTPDASQAPRDHPEGRYLLSVPRGCAARPWSAAVLLLPAAAAAAPAAALRALHTTLPSAPSLPACRPC